jgi:ribulose-5-phosphate 4-epimerase/fuculose-1-phosphate aldolase
MTNQEEGYIKFQCDWEQKSFTFAKKNLRHINEWRKKLYSLELVGVDENGIGFGNLSLREENSNRFYITGSETGKHQDLTKDHYARVLDYDIDKNYIKCVGKVRASSESLTHAAVYEADPAFRGVIHIHHERLWKLLKNKIPTTDPEVEYGTPEMAHEIKRLMEQRDVRIEKIVVMGGHKEGIITFGHDLDEAGEVLLKYYNELA